MVLKSSMGLSATCQGWIWGYSRTCQGFATGQAPSWCTRR
jgi:hypothetical protein